MFVWFYMNPLDEFSSIVIMLSTTIERKTNCTNRHNDLKAILMLVCLRRLCVLHLCFCTVQRQQPQGTCWENMVCSFMRLRRSIFKESGEKRIERGYKVGNKVILKHKTYYLIQRKSNWRKLGAGKVFLSRREHTNWWFSAKWSTLKTTYT